MPSLTPAEHQTVIDVLHTYVDSLSALAKMRPLSQEAHEKRSAAEVILAKLEEPDPLVKIVNAAEAAGNLAGRGKLHGRFRALRNLRSVGGI